MTETSSSERNKLRSELIFSKWTKFSETSKHASENTHIPVSGWVPLIFRKSAHTLLFQKVSTLLSARMCSHHYLPESALSLLHQYPLSPPSVPSLSSIRKCPHFHGIFLCSSVRNPYLSPYLGLHIQAHTQTLRYPPSFISLTSRLHFPVPPDS